MTEEQKNSQVTGEPEDSFSIEVLRANGKNYIYHVADGEEWLAALLLRQENALKDIKTKVSGIYSWVTFFGILTIISIIVSIIYAIAIVQIR